MTYQDVLAAPTYERRFFLLTFINEGEKKKEKYEEQREAATNSKAKGSRTTRVSGNQLKSKLKSGEIPG